MRALDMLSLDTISHGQSASPKSDTAKAKAREAAQDFEAVFLNSMFSQMFTDMDGEGPFGGDQATGVWRSFLTDEYSRSMAKRGGIGIADHVYHALLQQQEASNAPNSPHTPSSPGLSRGSR